MKELQQIIHDLSRREGFSTVVLTDSSGLPLATSHDQKTAQTLAAFVAEVMRLSERANERLGLTDMREIMLLSGDAQRGVLYRQFEAGDRRLVLAMFIRPQQAYWKETSRVIREIQQVL
jgi:predicted regulator of Ras-like GTPase activity (Roadblock/LC7/MglB family)